MNRRLSSTPAQRLVVAAWVLLALVALPFAARVNDELDATARLAGSESARVETALQERFNSPFTRIALLRIVGAPMLRTDEGRALLKLVIEALRRAPGVQGAMSYLDRDDALFIGQDGSPIVIVGLSSSRGSGDASVNLRATTDALHSQLRERYPQLDFRWTGEAAVNADMRRLSARETRAAELRVLPITLVLLLVAFRSWIAAILPLVCAGLTILISLGTLAVVNRVWPASILVVSIITMVGLGLSIDYSLLIVSRYRDGLNQGLSRAQSVIQAVEHGRRTVIISGSAVGIGFGAMLLVGVSEVRSIGMGGLVVTSITVLVASTLLPTLLAWLDPWIDAHRFGLGRGPDSGRHWRRWASWVTRHPLAVLALAGAPLLLLAAQAAHLRTDLPRGRWLPESAESVRVLHELDSVGRGNFGQLIQVILQLPPGTTLQDEAGWRAESKLVRFFARDPRIQHVWAATTLSTVPLAGPEILKRVPDSARRSLVSDDGRDALIELLPRQGLAATDAAALVRDIRAASPFTLTGLVGAHFEVGGVPGFNVDYEDAIKGAMTTVLLIVILATLLVLSLAFRSVLIPIKAVVLNLLSVAAAFGAVAIVFQDGHGSWLLGLHRPLAGGFPIVPILVFCIVFGLSMDYEVFIVARIADGRRAGLTDGDALVEGLAKSGRVVTFAAAIMVMIFGGFVFGEFVLIKILGFALGVAVFLDATVIRLALGPALIQLAGRWNWWPGARRPEGSGRIA
jgi:putative drug exporter of the RND superfamily